MYSINQAFWAMVDLLRLSRNVLALGDAPCGSPMRPSPNRLCSAWQGLLPGHCVTTGGDNKLLLCLTGLTACLCHCTRCLTPVRLLLLTTTLPLSCRTRSQVLLLLMICSCPGCVLLMCYSSMLRFSRSLLASTLSSLRRLNSGCHILMCHP